MAKNKAVTSKDASTKSGKREAAGRWLSTIKAPAAPPLFHSDDVGGHLGQDQAIREKVRLYPRASVKEIVAMFELDGLRVAPVAVQKVKRQATP